METAKKEEARGKPCIVTGDHGVESVEKPKRSAEKTGKHGEESRRSEFDSEYEGKTVRVTLHNGTVVIGRAKTSRYWLKLRIVGGKSIYVNKAYVVMIEPLE
ncbi:MAG: hypothetical protein QXL83_01055 [Zestosphaera sp.]